VVRSVSGFASLSTTPNNIINPPSRKKIVGRQALLSLYKYYTFK